jgi:tetratricopeptide (TPR) repeat protein
MWKLFGKGPTGPHCVNLLFHVANSVLLFLLLRRMTGAHWRSAWVAGMFALHPLHVESVAWVAERKDVLSTFFWMLTLLAYGAYVGQSKVQNLKSKVGEGGGKQKAESRISQLPASSNYLLALAFFALGLMSKPMLVTLPFVMLLLDGWPLGRFDFSACWRNPGMMRPFIREKTPFFLLSAASSAATLLAQHGAIQTLVNVSASQRMGNTVVSYVRYLDKMLWPTGLAVPYPHAREWPLTLVVIAAAVVAVLCLGAWRAGRRFPFVVTGWFWFFGTLIPVIGLVQVGIQSMADRYTYVPLVGIFIILAWWADGTARRWPVLKPVIAMAALVSVIVCGVLTRQQVGYWQDDERLFRHSTEVTEGNYVALACIGISLAHEGKPEEAMECYRKVLEINPRFVEAMINMGVVLAPTRGDEAIQWSRQALQTAPANLQALYNLGNELAKRKQYAEAVGCFETLLRSSPDHSQALNNLGNALTEVGRIEEAKTYYRRALKLAPNDVQILKNFATALVKQGQPDQAIVLLRKAVKQAPGDTSAHYDLGLAFALQTNWDEANLYYSETLRLAPGNPEAEYNLGYALREKGRLKEAVKHLEKARKQSPEFPLAHYNLGCVLADEGQKDEAAAHLKEALRLQPDYPEAKERLRGLGVPAQEGETMPVK